MGTLVSSGGTSENTKCHSLLSITTGRQVILLSPVVSGHRLHWGYSLWPWLFCMLRGSGLPGVLMHPEVTGTSLSCSPSLIIRHPWPSVLRCTSVEEVTESCRSAVWQQNSGQISVEGDDFQMHMIPEGQGTAHLPDVKDPKRRNVAKGKDQGAPWWEPWGGPHSSRGSEGKVTREIQDRFNTAVQYMELRVTDKCQEENFYWYFISHLFLFNIERLLILCIQKVIFKQTRNGSCEVPIVAPNSVWWPVMSLKWHFPEDSVPWMQEGKCIR